MRTFTRLIVAAALCASIAHAQDLGRVALVQALKDAACPLVLMCVAAHPDDEDGATLAYYRMKYGVKTIAVIATRGEGGQNEIGPELYADLGVIRTREMMNAARVEGSDLHFLNMPEFGFSKSPEETFEKWGHDVALERMRALLDELNPQVVITHHGLMKDHGHHQAIGQIIKEAVERGPGPGGIVNQRLYVRKFDESEAEATMDLGELEPVRGVTYAQVAAQALEEHKSQGMKLFIDRYLSGRPQARYHARVVSIPSGVGDDLSDDFGPLFKGVLTERRPAALVELAKRAEAGLSNADVLKDLSALSAADRAAAPHELAKAAAIAAELRVKAAASDTVVVRGEKISLATEFTDFGGADVATAKATLTGLRGGFEALSEAKDLTPQNGVASSTFEITVPDKAAFTMPNAEHFSDDGLFVPQLRVRVEGTTTNGASFECTQDIYLDVAPRVTLTFEGGPYLMNTARNEREAELRVKVKNFSPGPAQADVTLKVPVGWHVSPPMLSTSFDAEDQEQTVTAKVTAVESFTGRESIRAALADGPHTASVDAVCTEVALPKNAKIGLIRSYDDTMETTLKKLGVPYGRIGAEDFSQATLKEFTAVLVDMRAYPNRPDLVANNKALLDYVHAGGTALVMYHKNFDWKPAYAPYPLTVANNRVTREDAAMTLLVPEHPLFNAPNKIAPTDWDNWIQERGLYFAGEWDKAYTPLIECHDPGETIPPGALLTAKYGDGNYVYCALALYRQLRELNPGALRLFANLLAY